jgi:hypothetical protein
VERCRRTARQYPDRYNVIASTSYVTGSHSVKVGFQDSFGPYRRYTTANADLYQTSTNLVPARITVLNTPLQVEEYLDANLGLYAQDSWRLNKFTINVGLRFDHVKQHIVGQQAQIGRFANLIPYSDIDMPVWNDVSPRTSVVCDVFGNGKTAVRAGFNKFMTRRRPGSRSCTTRRRSPRRSRCRGPTRTRTTSPKANAAARSRTIRLRDQLREPAGELRRSLALAFDPGLQRPYQMAYNVGFSHEVRSGIAVTAEWFHSNFKDLIARNNVALTTNSYIPVTVVNPLDNSLITAYNLKPEFASAVQNVDSTDPNLKRSYNGIEINVNARLPHGARVFGGTSTERTISNSCSAAAAIEPVALLRSDEERDPLRDIGQVRHDVPAAVVWHHGERIAPASQAASWKRRASVRRVHRGYRFHATQRARARSYRWRRRRLRCTGLEFRVIGAVIIPGLTQTTLNVPLIAPQLEYTPRINQVDFALNKSFNVGHTRFMPKLDIFNMFNSDDYTAVSTMQFATATYKRPATILQGRIIRIGVDVKW